MTLLLLSLTHGIGCTTCGDGTVKVDGVCVATGDTGAPTVTDPNDDDDGDGYTPAEGDCDDDDGAVNPDATEICDNDADDDCDGQWAECRFDGALGPADAAATLSASSLVISHAGLVQDQDGDGLADFAVGGNQNGDGKVLLYAGTSTGTLETRETLATFTGSEDLDDAWATGDLSGDGQADWLLGARLHKGAASNIGIAYVFHGPAVGAVDLVTAADGKFQTGVSGEYVGSSVAIGDVDGGGDDAIVGGPSSGRDADGAVYVFSGGFSGSTSEASAVLRGDASEAPYYGEVGKSLAVVDLNGDGDGDLVVGGTGAQGFGAAFVVYSPVINDVDLSTDSDLILEYITKYDQTGETVSAAGDTDGDGLDDLWVGTPEDDSAGSVDEHGRAWLVRGPGFSGSLSNSDASLYGQSDNARLGTTIAGGGDLDADGHADVVTCAMYEDDYEGRAYVLYGPFSGNVPSNQADAVFSSGATGTQYTGRTMGSLDDADGDGLDDMALGSKPAAWLVHGAGL